MAVAFFRSRPVPLASFTSTMGIAALGLDWRGVSLANGISETGADLVLALDALVFIALLVRWLQRVNAHGEELANEMAGTISGAYSGAINISISLLAVAIEPFSYALSLALWIIGTVGSALLLLVLIGRWIEHGIEPADITPALLLPVVGNAASCFGAGLLGVTAIAMFPFALALVCWLAILPLTMFRLLAIAPRLPRKAAPQMGVLVSSPAVFGTAWSVLHHGAVDDVVIVLAFMSLALALVMLRMIRHIWGEPFTVAMWGWGFPLGALAGAFIHIAIIEGGWGYVAIAGAALTAATIVVAGCSAFAIKGWLRPAV